VDLDDRRRPGVRRGEARIDHGPEWSEQPDRAAVTAPETRPGRSGPTISAVFGILRGTLEEHERQPLRPGTSATAGVDLVPGAHAGRDPEGEARLAPCVRRARGVVDPRQLATFQGVDPDPFPGGRPPPSRTANLRKLQPRVLRRGASGASHCSGLNSMRLPVIVPGWRPWGAEPDAPGFAGACSLGGGDVRLELDRHRPPAPGRPRRRCAGVRQARGSRRAPCATSPTIRGAEEDPGRASTARAGADSVPRGLPSGCYP